MKLTYRDRGIPRWWRNKHWGANGEIDWGGTGVARLGKARKVLAQQMARSNHCSDMGRRVGGCAFVFFYASLRSPVESIPKTIERRRARSGWF